MSHSSKKLRALARRVLEAGAHRATSQGRDVIVSAPQGGLFGFYRARSWSQAEAVAVALRDPLSCLALATGAT